MTLRSLYRPTRYDRPVPRGWVNLGLWLLASWLVFSTAGYGLVSLVRGMLS